MEDGNEDRDRGDGGLSAAEEGAGGGGPRRKDVTSSRIRRSKRAPLEGVPPSEPPQEDGDKEGDPLLPTDSDEAQIKLDDDNASPSVKPPKGGKLKEKGTKKTADEADEEKTKEIVDAEQGDLVSGPLRILSVRTDPVKALQARQRRLDRLAAVSMPEIHLVGQIVSGQGLISHFSEGATCR